MNERRHASIGRRALSRTGPPAPRRGPGPVSAPSRARQETGSRETEEESEVPRLGLLLPSSGTVQEADFYRRVPAQVTVHATRMHLVEATEAAEVRMLEEHTMPASARRVRCLTPRPTGTWCPGDLAAG
jgi:hypothetical protein